MSELVTAVCVLGVVYALGGIHGLHMAWTQPARMRSWARRVEARADRRLEARDSAL